MSSILRIAACLALLAAVAEADQARQLASPPTWGFFGISDEGDPLRDLPLVTWSRNTGLHWGKLELPPGSGRYDWDYMDGLVRKAQTGGYNLVFVLKTGNDPGVTVAACARSARRSKQEPHLKSCPIQPAQEAAWKRLVGAIVERYDGDGKGDMPSLARGFKLDLQIENEAGSPNYWYPGESDGGRAAKAYLPALRLAYEAKQAANPATRIIAPGIIQPNQLARCTRQSRDPDCSKPYHVRNRDFTEELLRHADYFDAVDIHFFNYFHFDPAFVPDGIAWVRDQLRRAGKERPIYSLEWTAAMMMDVRQNEHAREFAAYFPFAELRSVESFRSVYQRLAEPRNEKYRRWFEEEQAREFPKLFTTMLAHGVERMIHVPFHDYVGQGWNSPFWNWQGIVRYEGTRSRPVLVRKPAFYAYQALARKLAGLSGVEVMSSGKDVIAYRFTFPDRAPVGIAWTEQGERTLDLSGPVKAGQVKLTPLAAQIDTSERPTATKAETVRTSAVRVTGTPVWIEAADSRR